MRRSLARRLVGVLACAILSVSVFMAGFAHAHFSGVEWGVYYTWTGWGIFCGARDNGYADPGAFGANWHVAGSTYTRTAFLCGQPYTSNEYQSAYVSATRNGNTVCGTHFDGGYQRSQATAVVLENSSPGFVCDPGNVQTEITAQHSIYWASDWHNQTWIYNHY